MQWFREKGAEQVNVLPNSRKSHETVLSLVILLSELVS